MNFDPEPPDYEYVEMGKFTQKARGLESYENSDDEYYYFEEEKSLCSKICTRRLLCAVLSLVLLAVSVIALLVLVAVIRTLMLEDPYKRWNLSDAVEFKDKLNMSEEEKLKLADRSDMQKQKSEQKFNLLFY